MSELKPCPFCGDEVLWSSGNITCSRCNLKFRPYMGYDATNDAWNRRAEGYCAFAQPTDLTDGCALLQNDYEDAPKFAYGNDAEYWHDEYEKLAKAVDVIRDATERTCRNTQDDADFMCSECGKMVDNGRLMRFNYCPNCGARVIL